MKTSTDILRSLKRYVAEALPDSYEVRIDAEEGTFSRPSAIISPTPAGAQLQGTGHVRQQGTEYVQSFQVMCHPVLGDTPMESLITASYAEACLVRAFRQGVGEGKPARMPVYDYDGVPADQPSSTRQKTDFARVLDLSVGKPQSPTDELIYTVTAEVRLGWTENSALPSAGRDVQEVRTSFSTS